MTELLAGTFALIGALFVLAGAIALLRFPDVYARLSGSSKAGTIGIGGLLVGLVVVDFRIDTLLGAILLSAFLSITLPLAAHIIGHIAYWTGIPPAPGTSPDDLRKHLQKEERKKERGE